jgi:hypothetical protein
MLYDQTGRINSMTKRNGVRYAGVIEYVLPIWSYSMFRWLIKVSGIG